MKSKLFTVGQRVVCVDQSWMSDHLTFGKDYVILEYGSYTCSTWYVCVTDDNGVDIWAFEDRFGPIEVRDKPPSERFKAEDVLVFKSSKMVDWGETEKLVIAWLTEKYKGYRPSELTMSLNAILKDLRNAIRRKGTRKAYLYVEMLKARRKA